MSKVKTTVSVLLIAVGIALLIINLYGLSQEIRPNGIMHSDFRFKDDLDLTYQQSLAELVPKPGEKKIHFAIRANKIVSKSLAHIEWDDESDVTKYHQLIPIWENYFLYFMGKYSGIPEFKKYHYADYKKSLKRGIGICNDASMVLSQILSKHNIKNKIVTFPGHVVVWSMIDTVEYIFDPDFGVKLKIPLERLRNETKLAAHQYEKAGYPYSDEEFFMQEYKNNYHLWGGASDLITKKYYFEKIAYFLKWPLPILLIAFGVLLMRKNKKT